MVGDRYWKSLYKMISLTLQTDYIMMRAGRNETYASWKSKNSKVHINIGSCKWLKNETTQNKHNKISSLKSRFITKKSDKADISDHFYILKYMYSYKLCDKYTIYQSKMKKHINQLAHASQRRNIFFVKK